jgi:hypothetical protein
LASENSSLEALDLDRLAFHQQAEVVLVQVLREPGARADHDRHEH